MPVSLEKEGLGIETIVFWEFEYFHSTNDFRMKNAGLPMYSAGLRFCIEWLLANVRHGSFRSHLGRQWFWRF